LESPQHTGLSGGSNCHRRNTSDQQYNNLADNNSVQKDNIPNLSNMPRLCLQNSKHQDNISILRHSTALNPPLWNSKWLRNIANLRVSTTETRTAYRNKQNRQHETDPDVEFQTLHGEMELCRS
jgi:hypothetical protein